MESLIHADIFFFVSTIAICVLAIGGALIIIYIIRILHNVLHISKRVKEEGEEILQDMKELRGNIKNEGFKFKYLTAFFKGMFKRSKSRSKKSEEN